MKKCNYLIEAKKEFNELEKLRNMKEFKEFVEKGFYSSVMEGDDGYEEVEVIIPVLRGFVGGRREFYNVYSAKYKEPVF